MPGTRSSSKHPRPSPKKPITQVDNEVILISDDEQPARKKPASTKAGSSNIRAKRKAPLPFIGGEILEILTSSDDESFSVNKADTNKELVALQQQLKKLQSVRVVWLLQI